MMGVFVILAVVFKKKMPGKRGYFTLTTAFLAIHFLAVILRMLFSSTAAEDLAFTVISSIFEGAAIALLEVAFVVLLVKEPLKISAVAIAASYLLADVYYCVLLYAPAGIVSAAMPVGKIISLALLLRLFIITKPESTVSEGDDNGAEDEELPLELGSTPLVHSLAFVASIAFIWGIFAQLSGQGTIAFFDAASEIVVISVRIILLVFCIYAGTRFTFRSFVAFISTLFTTGILIIGLIPDDAGFAIGGIILKSGLYVVQVLVLVLAIRAVRTNRTKSIFLISLVFFVGLFGQFSRLGGYLFVDLGNLLSVQAPSAAGIALGILIIVLLVVLVPDKQRVPDLNLNSIDTKDHLRPSRVLDVDETIAEREMDFIIRFSRLCDEIKLSDRERQVLFEALHGYTINGIAAKLFLGRESVKTYLSRAYSRAGVKGKQEFLKMLDFYEHE
jgi:DNA-binding CsgD family transcriptional regulator